MKQLFINSLPKSGTNLVQRLAHLCGYSWSQKSIAASMTHGRYSVLKVLVRAPHFSNSCIQVGLETPSCVKLNLIRKMLSKLDNGTYISGHASYSHTLHRELVQHDICTVQVLRDPFDVLVSLANYLGTDVSKVGLSQQQFRFFKDMSFMQKARLILYGGQIPGRYHESYANILEMVSHWLDHENVFVMRFEDLIGSKGGGSDNKQTEVIRSFLDFTDINLNNNLIENVASNLFGGTHTFRKGRIGSYREELDSSFIREIEDIINPYVGTLGY